MASDKFGMDKELAEKEAAKFDPQLQATVVHYIEDLTKERVGSDIIAGLKDGQILCKLGNAVKPGSIKTVNTSTMPFKQMENIANFLAMCRKELKMAEHDLFTTADLYDGKSKVNVINGIVNFSRAATKSGYRGHSIAPKESNKSSSAGKWDDEIGKANSSVSKLSLGSSEVMERTQLDTSKSITFGNEKSGGAGSSAMGKLSMGSLGIMERPQVDVTKNIDFGAKAGNKKN
jgi:hypothetical protein